MRHNRRAGRIAINFQAGLGWSSIFCGAAIFISFLLAKFSPEPQVIRELVVSIGDADVLLLGTSLTVGGLLAVTLAQGVRAQLDTAEYTRQLLKMAWLEDSTNDLDNVPVLPVHQKRNETEFDNGSRTIPGAATTFQSKGWRVHKLEDGTFAINTTVGWQRYNTLEELDAATEQSWNRPRGI